MTEKGEELEKEKVNKNSEKVCLWNPRSACNWSVLFTPVFGSYIQSKNWLSLGDEAKAKSSMMWCYVSIAYLLTIPFVTIPAPFGPLGPIILILAWYLCSGIKQMEYVAINNPDYEHKPWGKALLAGLCGTVVGFAVLLGAAFLLSPSLDEVIESNSKTLVNQVVHEQFKQNVNCTKVEILEKTSGQSFTAKAFMDDNTVRKIKITYDGQNLYVEVPPGPSY